MLNRLTVLLVIVHFCVSAPNTNFDKHGQKSIISTFIPGFENWNQAVNAQNWGNLAAGVPILQTITRAIPSLRTLPGMNVPSGAQPVSPNRNLNSAIEQFTAPIVRVATGGQPVASDVQQFIHSIPNFIFNYTESVAVLPANTKPTSTGNTTVGGGVQMAELWKLLPPRYNISKIPQEVLAAVMRGEFPDMKKLPSDLLNHFKQNADKMASLFTKVAPANTTLDDILAKIPTFEKPVLSTFSPYDINKLSTDMIHEEEIKARAVKMRMYTAIALGLVGAVTLVVLGFFVVYLKKQRANKARLNQTTTQLSH